MPKISHLDLIRSLPDVRSPKRFAALQSLVEIFRDPWGIPHIRADCEADLYFAQGFVTAQDRLWHMDYDRMRALGRWGEYVGIGAVDHDRFMRTVGMGRTARLDYETCNEESRTMLDCYTAGVNAYLESTGTKDSSFGSGIPIEYHLLGCMPEPWEPWHCISVYKMRNTLLGTFEPKLLRTRLAQNQETAAALARIIKGYPHGHLVTVPPGEEWQGEPLDGLPELLKVAEEVNWLGQSDMGSNAFSVGGTRTRSGQPLVAGDSHRALDTPSVYYQVHLRCPDYSIVGYSLPGMPGIMHFCHNEYVAWGMTYGSADTQDLFIERFREVNGEREFQFKDEWRKAVVLRERLEVKGANPVDLEVTITHHGPIIAGDPVEGHGIAISDPGLLEGTPWVDAMRDAMRSRSVNELHSAFEKWNDRVNNYAVCDISGNFGYLHAGRIPVRDEANGWRAVSGHLGDNEWRGYIPHHDLPRSINPECGYVITCNQRVAQSDYPYYVGIHFAPGYRARRIQKRILELEAITVEDMTSILSDRVSIPARNLVGRLIRLEGVDSAFAEALSILEKWDYRMDLDRIAPTIYAEVRAQLVERMARTLFGDDGEVLLSGAAGADVHLKMVAIEVDRALLGDGDCLLDGGIGWDDLLKESLSLACRALSQKMGPDPSGWRWGEAHRTRPRHPLSDYLPEAADQLAPPSLGVHGDADTPLAGGYTAINRYDVTGLSVTRYVFDPSDWRNSKWIVPLGASGHPGSPHYIDQAKMWIEVEFVPQLWDWTEIEDKAESRQQLLPGSVSHRN